MTVRYRVDLGELERVISSLDDFGRTLRSQIEQLDQVNTQLHRTWQGEAAVAQTAAHRKIRQGADEVHRGLVDMHAAAAKARDNYQAAIRANQETWGQVQ